MQEKLLLAPQKKKVVTGGQRKISRRKLLGNVDMYSYGKNTWIEAYVCLIMYMKIQDHAMNTISFLDQQKVFLVLGTPFVPKYLSSFKFKFNSVLHAKCTRRSAGTGLLLLG